MTKTTITCDHCGNVLSTPDVVPKFRVCVTCVPVGPSGPTLAAVHVAPPISTALDFCDTECLVAYFNASADDSK